MLFFEALSLLLLFPNSSILVFSFPVSTCSYQPFWILIKKIIMHPAVTWAGALCPHGIPTELHKPRVGRRGRQASLPAHAWALVQGWGGCLELSFQGELLYSQKGSWVLGGRERAGRQHPERGISFLSVLCYWLLEAGLGGGQGYAGFQSLL